MKSIFLSAFCMFVLCLARAEDGYRLWLRYDRVKNQALLQAYRQSITGLCLNGESATIGAVREELLRALEGLLGRAPALTTTAAAHTIIAGTPASAAFIASLPLQEP